MTLKGQVVLLGETEWTGMAAGWDLATLPQSNSWESPAQKRLLKLRWWATTTLMLPTPWEWLTSLSTRLLNPFCPQLAEDSLTRGSMIRRIRKRDWRRTQLTRRLKRRCKTFSRMSKTSRLSQSLILWRSETVLKSKLTPAIWEHVATKSRKNPSGTSHLIRSLIVTASQLAWKWISPSTGPSLSSRNWTSKTPIKSSRTASRPENVSSSTSC